MKFRDIYFYKKIDIPWTKVLKSNKIKIKSICNDSVGQSIYCVDLKHPIQERANCDAFAAREFAYEFFVLNYNWKDAE